MKTRRLFRENVYQAEGSATVASVQMLDGNTVVTLDQTIFFPTGGGQSCDKGTLGGYNVVDVYERDDEIFHVLEPSCAETAEKNQKMDTIKTGCVMGMKLDWEHRFDNMQRHCGEHILSGMFFREYGGVNRGFHMGDQYMTVDISLEAKPEFQIVTWEMAKHVELCTNEAIWSNAPVITRHFDTKEEAEHLPLRKALAIEKDITIVCVGSMENPADCVACCGTHPSTAGQVGMIKIFKVEPNKGMFRIYFEAGKRAFLKYQNEMDTLNKLCTKLSAGTEDILDKYDKQQEKNKEVRNQLHFLKKDLIAKEASSIIDEIKGIADGSGHAEGGKPGEQKRNQGSSLESRRNGALPVRRYALFTLDDITALAREIGSEAGKLCFLVCEPEKTVFLLSDGKVDCGKLVKENASIYNGKGGGSKTLARAIFANDEYIDTFIDLIEKHLR